MSVFFSIFVAVFNHFEKDGEYFCFAGQSSQSLTAMYNSYRASQIVFPGDDDGLEQLRAYCRAFLEERRATGNLMDKWVIANGLPSEVRTVAKLINIWLIVFNLLLLNISNA